MNKCYYCRKVLMQDQMFCNNNCKRLWKDLMKKYSLHKQMKSWPHPPEPPPPSEKPTGYK